MKTGLTQTAENQNIFLANDGKYWIESADDLDESSHQEINEYHGCFDTLKEAVEYMNNTFDHPEIYFVDKSGKRKNPYHEEVMQDLPQDRSGSRQTLNTHTTTNAGNVSVSTVEPKMYYVQTGNILYSLKSDEFVRVLDSPGCIINYKTLKHLPTSVTRSGDNLFSSDLRRPMYYLDVDGSIKKR